MSQRRHQHYTPAESPSLFAAPPLLPPYSEPTTSRDAALSMIRAAGEQEQLVYDALVVTGGATCAELELRLRLRHQSCSARLNGLVRRRLVHTGPDKRLTPSGRWAWVYHVGGRSHA